MLIVPSVTMIVGIRNSTPSRPLASPHAAPVAKPTNTATGIGIPSRSATAVMILTSVRIAPTDRSISPIDKSSTMPTDMMP